MKKTTVKTKKMKTVEKKLPADFKKDWLEALRSGKFKQTTGSLCAKGEEGFEYCVLGVAAKIGNCENIKNKTYIDHEEKVKYTDNFPKLLTGDQGIPEKLATMNDTGRTFPQIAAWIEKNL